MIARPPSLVVHVVYRFAVGGLENGLVNLINGLAQDAWRHAVISLTDVDAGFCRRVSRGDVEYVALNKGPGHAFPLYPKLFQLFRKMQPQVVHTRNLAALEACVPAWASGTPTRIHGEHGRDVHDLDGSSRRYQWLRRAFRPFVTRYVAVSPDLERYLRDRVGIPARRIEQIYNGVDTIAFCPAPRQRGSIEGCPFQDPRMWLVGTVGRMERVKDQANLARAFVSALAQHPAARERMRLVMVGEGTLKPEVESILEESGARDLAWLPGERSNVPEVLRGLDCFVLPSLAEGVSNTILEAMATGLPVVATRVGANADLVEDEVTGRLVRAGDSDALARAIVPYFNDPATARRHGRGGRQRAETRFSLQRMVERYHRLYTQVAHVDAPEASKAPSAARGPSTLS
jgi:sugar transferase (PEP-CTERM/EpsH1 system associated)